MQQLHAALLWAGEEAAGEGRSAGAVYGLEGVGCRRPEVTVPRSVVRRHKSVSVSRTDRRDALMIRRYDGVRVTGVEATIVRLAHRLDEEALEIASEDARRRRLTSMTALNVYLDRYARPGQRGVATLRRLLHELDPVHPARSTLEVKTRRLLAARGLGGFEREFPLEWDGRTYYFDFAYCGDLTIVETNGKRFHDDPIDFEHEQEKRSVPGRHGYKLVMATYDKVTRHPDAFIRELQATLSA
jgi:hypothetical protein